MQRRPGFEEDKPVERKKQPKIAWRPAFEITASTSKGQAAGAASFNEMRQWIINEGGMEEK